MTNLNEVIAKAKGWDLKHGEPVYFEVNFEDGDGADGFECPRCHKPESMCKNEPCFLDYQGDANLYMQLFEEMSSEFFSLNIMQHDYNNKTTIIGDYRQGHGENIPQFVVESQPIGTAICLAWLKMKGIEI